VNNHLNSLLAAKLICIIAETRKKHLIEKTYQAVAKKFWLSSTLTLKNETDRSKLKSKLSLHNLLIMSEKLQNDAANLLNVKSADNIPSIGVTANITFKSSNDQKNFTKEYLNIMHNLLEKYNAGTGSEKSFTAMLVCYPKIYLKKE